MVPLLQLPKCGDYRPVLPHPASRTLEVSQAVLSKAKPLNLDLADVQDHLHHIVAFPVLQLWQGHECVGGGRLWCLDIGLSEGLSSWGTFEMEGGAMRGHRGIWDGARLRGATGKDRHGAGGMEEHRVLPWDQTLGRGLRIVIGLAGVSGVDRFVG